MVSKEIFKIFLWKNWKRIVRNWKSSVIFMLLPLAFSLYLSYISAGAQRHYISFEEDFYLRNITHYIEDKYQYTFRKNDYIRFAPNDEDFRKSLEAFQDLANNANYSETSTKVELKVSGYENDDLVYEAAEDHDYDAWYSYILIDKKQNRTEYVIRMLDSSLSYRKHSVYLHPEGSFNIFEYQLWNVYKRSHFLLTQMGVEIFYLQLKLNESGGKYNTPTYSMCEIPVQNGANADVNQIRVFTSISIFILISTCVSMVLLEIVDEKQDGIKEIFETVTTKNYLNHVSIFIFGFMVSFIFISIVLFFEIVIYDTFSCHQVFYPLLLVVLFILCLLSYTFFISVFFDRVSYAAIVGFILYIAPYIMLSMSESFKFLSPIVLYDEGMLIFKNTLTYDQCFTGADIFYDEHPIRHHTIFEIYLSLFLTSFMYLFLYFYFSNVFPGKLGTPKPFYFLFTKSYWCPNRRQQDEMMNPLTRSATQPSDSNPLYVQVNNLCKTFQTIPFCGSKFTAVKDVSFYLQENRITILMGHNGAGKTTIMNMMTGLLTPTSGTVTLDDQADVSIYRTSIGYCPQHNIFLNYLTCREHLYMFGKLRGLNDFECANETKIWLDKVNLKSSTNKQAKLLSNETKRRLALACALIGHTKLVILDEPSTGLDPEARRDLWNILLTLRKERTILLTTHSMEDVDVLGDKVMVLDQGTIVCEGTKFALKKQYGSGYTMKIMMNHGFSMTRTMELITARIPNAKIKSEIAPTLLVLLPYESLSSYSEVLRSVEEMKVELGIDSISMSNTTMDEVFQKSATEKKIPEQDDEHVNGQSYVKLDSAQPKTFFEVISTLFLAISYKKLIFIKRSPIRFLLHVLIPIFVILICELSVKTISKAYVSKNHNDRFEVTAKHIDNQQIMLVANQTIPEYEKVVDRFKELAHERDIHPIIKTDKSAKISMEEFENSTDKRTYSLKFICAIEVFSNTSGLHLNIFHQMPIIYSSSYCINFATNLMLMSYTDSHETLTVVNWPKASEYKESDRHSEIYGDLIIIFFPMGFFLYIIFYVYLPFKEESTDFRVIQKVSPGQYWLVSYGVDVIQHTVISLLHILFIWIFDTTNVIESSTYWKIFGIISMVGYVNIAVMYLLAKVVKSLSVIYTLYFASFFVALYGFSELQIRSNRDSIFYGLMLRLIPHCTLWHEFFNLLSYHYREHITHSIILSLTSSFIEITMALVIVIFVCENIYIRSRVQHFLALANPIRLLGKRKIRAKSPVNTNPDVTAESELVKDLLSSGRISDYMLIVSKLEKYYGLEQVVQGVDFTVKKGECFGLLGMNAAGKSTIFKMLTLNTAISGGDAFIDGCHDRRQVKSYMQQIGYCPELSALLDFMSSYETLKYLAWIKGTPYRYLDSVVKMWLAKMDLKNFKDVPISGYSGGTKRKLNTAVAMISDPSIIFLDEPTSGVDPMSRRFMWRCIQDLQSKKKTVVLTSHSMDECEELCNRLAIMVSGQMKCLGNIQKLKEQYGNGYTLMIKMKDGLSDHIMDTIKAGIRALYPCQLYDDYADTLIFNIIEKDIKWSLAFTRIQEFCEKNSQWIEDYTVTEVSLEDIFLQFRTNDRNAKFEYNNSSV